MVSKMVQSMGGLARFKQQTSGAGSRPGAGGMPQLPPGMDRNQLAAMQNMLPPEIKAQLRQPGGREKLMAQIQRGEINPAALMGGAGGAGGLGGFPGMGGGAGGTGGMPDLGAMMQQMGGMGGMGNMMKMFGGMMGGGGGAGPGAGGSR